MKLELGEIIIRDMEPKDVVTLREIVHEPEIRRYMGDWAENSEVPGRLEGYVEWLYSQRDSKDVRENKRYAIACTKTDALIGMVGMGEEETSGEVEIAYFMRESCRHKGYTVRAVHALVKWCFSVTTKKELPWLILTIDCANEASCRLGEKCGFVRYEKRTPIGHRQPNMVSDSYYYYRRYRESSGCSESASLLPPSR